MERDYTPISLAAALGAARLARAAPRAAAKRVESTVRLLCDPLLQDSSFALHS